MTWSARFTDKDGNLPAETWTACQKCKHGQYDFRTGFGRSIKPCSLSNVGQQLSSLMTSVDVGADGWMASGEAILKCNGFEPIEG